MGKNKRECYIGDDGYCHVPLANGKNEAICDKEFVEEVNKYNWRFFKGYSYCTTNGKLLSMHKLLYLLKHNSIGGQEQYL